jgi:hypothetical protein
VVSLASLGFEWAAEQLPDGSSETMGARLRGMATEYDRHIAREDRKIQRAQFRDFADFLLVRGA